MRRFSAGALGCGIAAAMLVWPAVARAGTFDIKGADVEAGEREISVPAAVQARFPQNADRVHQSWEVGFSYGFSDRFKLGGKANLDQPLPGEPDDGEAAPLRGRLRASTLGAEAQYVLIKPSDGSLALSWFAGVDAAVHRDETNTLTVGPLIGIGGDALSLTLNPLLARTFGRNGEPGVAFDYAWQLRRGLVDGAALAIEGYGTIPDIADAPPVEMQEHRIGPVLILDGNLLGGHGNGPSMRLAPAAAADAAKPAKIELQMGVLLGMTEATPDLTGKLKLSVTW